MIRCVTVMNVLKSYQNAAFSGVQKESIYHESPAHQRQPPREGLHLYRTEPHRRGAERRRHRDGDPERRHKARGRLHRLRRLCRRALVGLSRTGSYCGNGSGEIVIAFTTANRVPHYSEKAILPMGMVHDDAINPLFRAVAECVEESVLSSLLHAETVTGYHGRTVRCLSDLLDKK